jgi:hypothetical protein
MLMDHSQMNRDKVALEVARADRLAVWSFCGELLDDLASGVKLFAYRTHGHTLDGSMQIAPANAVSRCGKGALLYVQHLWLQAAAPPPPPSAMDYLTQSTAIAEPGKTPPPIAGPTLLQRLRRRLRVQEIRG